MNTSISIGSKIIGQSYRPLIIAEMSGNHHGNIDRAFAIVDAAAKNGADAIKLQTFTPDTLTIDSKRHEFLIDDSESPWFGKYLWDLYSEAYMPWEWQEELFKFARNKGLACISTIFDISSLEFLLSIGVDAIKIASFELIHIPLLSEASCCGKPLLLSIGMATLDEIQKAVETIRKRGCENFILLKCTSAYPSTEKDANILTIPDLRSRYNCYVGLSDHTLSPYAAFAAVAHGAVMIEKHFTLSRSERGVDSSFSIEPAELHQLRLGTEMVWESLGKVCYEPLSSEKTSLKERPSIYVVKSIKSGETFTHENVRIIRPSGGLLPEFYDQVIGRKAKVTMEAGTPLSWDIID
ncbi:pseudaminic acid synthase [Thermosynechococcus sp. GLH187]|uniref:pseudaminic acid synthase n=1 Tax=unclassified Thermosynechococcus TaxID=2622553 RepID=UPI00122E4DBC|nr:MULTISPECIES: pseudaminic acid synthase [unclassified Thermosynechococcus]QEQ00031.1 pseudaminic acid synthase [Thermosynechococcus sp. CL-1]QSF49336.1 pseudaminic acid synthase [Thermosynechococcus sp. TA-1]WJI24226.1 pseudaminic acid synthase [Thermosynechococcus sp. B0]WJI26741.1 pseudaminic acid synthase [Thermosynechococcus sp. B1]WJI29273.1 pseudaminic acid synthase [Thermosynechococcus sp. B3]